MSTNYVSRPFIPWWDESKTGAAPTCEICGAVMVRFPTPTDMLPENLPTLGWKCLACSNFHADEEPR